MVEPNRDAAGRDKHSNTITNNESTGMIDLKAVTTN